MMIRHRQGGFTIIEFMIASSVFGVILLVVTGAVLFMNQAYQKSVYASRTQSTTSNLVDVIGQSIKFSGGDNVSATSGDTQSWCIGNRQFLYTVGRQLNGSNPATSTPNAFVSRQMTGASCTVSPVTAPLSGTYNELLGRGMRLAKLTIDDSQAPMYTISARVIYGDDDMLCSDTVAGSCDVDSTIVLNPAQIMAASGPTSSLRCRPGTGSEFCAMSELSTSVYRRL